MKVPFRRIHLTDPDPGYGHLDVYDTRCELASGWALAEDGVSEGAALRRSPRAVAVVRRG
jgi:hypothetical protein